MHTVHLTFFLWEQKHQKKAKATLTKNKRSITDYILVENMYPYKK